MADVWHPRDEANRWNTRDRLQQEGRLGKFLAELRLRWHRDEDPDTLGNGKLIQNTLSEAWYETLANYPPMTEEEKAAVRDKNHEPNEDWPFWITPGAADIELAEGAHRDSDYAADVEWVGQNVGNKHATPLGAPSNAAWQLLIGASLNAASRKAFYKDHYRPVMEKRAGAADELIARKSEVKSFDLLNAFEGWKNCPHCGGEVC